jgi:hypothetical protein
VITTMVMDPNIPEDSDAANRMPLRQRTLDPAAMAAAAAAAAGAPLAAPLPPPTSQPLSPKPAAAADDYRCIAIRTFDTDNVGGPEALLQH